MFASSNIIYKRIANAYTRCRRITNPTKRLFNVPLDLWSLAKQESFFLQRFLLGWICNPTVMSISIFNA